MVELTSGDLRDKISRLGTTLFDLRDRRDKTRSMNLSLLAPRLRLAIDGEYLPDLFIVHLLEARRELRKLDAEIEELQSELSALERAASRSETLSDSQMGSGGLVTRGKT